MTDPRHAGFLPALRRIRLVARQTLEEALRMRLTVLFGAVAAMMLLGARWLREFNFGAPELAFLGDFGLGAIGWLGTLLAALATAQLFFNDLAAGTTACILTRPVRRWEYLAGKFAGVSALLVLFTAGLGGLLGAMILWRGHQLGVAIESLPAFFYACALQCMKCIVVAAMTLMVSAYAGSSLFASCAGLMLALIGHLRDFATGPLEWFRVWPNLALFDGGGVLAGNPVPTASAMAHLAAYWVFCVAGLLALASYAFKRREF